MKELNHCPSTLADGFSTYSPTACKKLFDGQKVSHLLDFEIDEISKTSETMVAMRRISVSGAQEKFPAVIENGIIRISQTDERSRYILKPAPWYTACCDSVHAFLLLSPHPRWMVRWKKYCC